MVSGFSHAAKRDTGAQAPALIDHVELDTFMHRMFDHDRAHNVEINTPDDASASARNVHPRRDFEMASELLDRASQAFDLLIHRCQQLEADLDTANEHARIHAAGQAETIERWKRLASGLKTQMDASDQAAALLKARCDAAEARALMAEGKAAALERASVQAAGHAAMAESLSTRLHDKVVSAFGIGSRAHPVLEIVATQVAAE